MRPGLDTGRLQLEISGLHKRYGKNRALDGLDLDSRAGEVLGIAGPNGAGKSTMVRVLAGEDAEDRGRLLLDGTPWAIEDRRRDVAVVHQEPKLFPTLTVAENLMVGVERTRFLRPQPRGRETAIAEEFGLSASWYKPLEQCSLVTQQLVEIARAILHDARAFLFDEPNSALTVEESAHLFGHIQRLRDEGRCIVALVTHRLTDLVQHCDRVVVIRDGRLAGRFEGDKLTTHNLGQAIAGTASPDGDRGDVVADADAGKPCQPAGRSRALLRASGWTDRSGVFKDIDVEVREGQALVITGQEGAGGRELIRSLAGLRRATGKLTIDRRGRGSELLRPVCYVPADRSLALFQNLSVAANLAARLGRGRIAHRGGFLRLTRITGRGQTLMDRLRIRAESPGAAIGSLSGGNQQKVSVGAALAAGPQVLLIEEPTRGVDVATKEQIYSALRDYMDEGHGVMSFSPELDVAYRLADTVRVMLDGRLSDPLEINNIHGLDELTAWVDRISTAGRATDQPERSTTNPARSQEAQR